MLNSTGYVQSRRGEYTKVAALKVGLLRLNVLAGTRYKVQGTRYKVPGTRYKVQGTRYKVQGTRYKVQGTWNLKWHEISKDMKSQMTSNLNPTPHISKFLRYSEFCYTGEFSAKDFFKTKQKWVLFIHYYVNCHELLMFMKCQMSNVECGMFTVHNCALLFTTVHKYSLFTTVHNKLFNVHCSQLLTTVHCSQLCTTVHNCRCSHLITTLHRSQLFTTVHNCTQLFTTVHDCSQLFTVNNCSPFTAVHCRNVTNVWNYVQLSATVHCSHLITVHNCSPFTTDCSQLCTVCLFLKDRCTN